MKFFLSGSRMSLIALFIPESALREAVAEQIALMALGEAKECADWDTACAAAEAGAKVLIVNALCFLELKKDAHVKPDVSRCPVLALGEGHGSDAEELIAESFPYPLRLGHVMARLRYYLETAPKLRTDIISCGPWRLEPQRRQITHEASSEVIRLTEKECALLSYLAQSQSPVSREELLASIWGYDARIDTHTLETHVYQLRRKLASCHADEDFLVNEQGAYALKRNAT